MMNLQAFGGRESFALSRVQVQVLAHIHAFVWAHLISFNSADLRCAAITLALRVFGAAWVFAERQLGQWARRVLRSAWRGARFAAEISDADTMVAAGGR